MNKKRFWILIGIGSLIVLFFILLSNVLEVGERLRNIHAYVEYGFYGLSFILFYVLIVNPIRVITLSPTFTVDAMLSDEVKRHGMYKKAANELIRKGTITDEDKELLQATMNQHDQLRESLIQIFDTTIKSNIEEVIIRNGKSVLITTALSQNGNLDMLSVLSINLKMIKEIVEASGFRPSYPYLAKLSLNVMITSLIAEGIEDIDMTEYMPTKIGETLTDVPFLKTISSSIIGGIANGMLTCRVGIITQKYLYNDNQLLDKKAIRRMAYKESVKLMPRIISEGLVAFPKGIATLFSRPFKKKAKKEQEEEEKNKAE
jgi:uncharacterized membrane protein YcjF (UPF0283 family)